MAKSNSIAAQYPFKALYTAGYIAFVLAQLPLLLLYYIPRHTRQHPQWSYRSAVTLSLLRLWFRYASTVEFRFATSLKPGAEGDRFVIIQPAPSKFYVEVLDDPTIRPTVAGGTWYPKRFDTRDSPAHADRKIILHFHGGAFVLMSSREMDSGYGARSLSRHFNDALVFCPEYRLATAPNGRFPAALQDAVTAYKYLLDDLNIPASSIIFSGDSAGGNLVMALLRYITDTSNGVTPLLPLPSAALLWSPWIDLEDPYCVDRSRNAGRDMADSHLTRFGIQYYTTGADGSVPKIGSRPYISPLQAPFAVQLPVFVHAGTGEVLYEVIVAFTKGMKEAGCRSVELCESAHAPHDIYGGGDLLGFHDLAQEAMHRAADFVGESLGARGAT